jgi:sodium--glutamate symport carrier gltS
VSKTRDRIYETYNLVIRHSIWSETGHSDCGGVPGARVSLGERYEPAPRAFLVVPMAGAFFIGFANALTNV